MIGLIAGYTLVVNARWRLVAFAVLLAAATYIDFFIGSNLNFIPDGFTPFLIFVDPAGLVRGSSLVNHKWQLMKLWQLARVSLDATAPPLVNFTAEPAQAPMGAGH